MRIILTDEFYCTQCGNKGIPIVRQTGSERAAGHLKRIYCLKCQKETNHAECKPYSHYSYEDFKFEFENGNFDKKGNRKMKYGLFKNEMNKKGILV